MSTETGGTSARLQPMVICRVAVTVECTDGHLNLERSVRLPCVPRAGDWLWDESFGDSGCWSDAGIQIERVGFCVADGDILLDCGHETAPLETREEAMSWYPGFTVLDR